MAQLIKLVNILLPDDILEYITEIIKSSIVFSPPKEILDDIKYFYKLERYIKLVNDVDHPQQLAYLYDIGVVYFSIQNSNKPRLKYNRTLVPVNFFDNLLVTIDNSKNPMKKTATICVNYMLKIPYRHIRYIFKKNRDTI